MEEAESAGLASVVAAVCGADVEVSCDQAGPVMTNARARATEQARTVLTESSRWDGNMAKTSRRKGANVVEMGPVDFNAIPAAMERAKRILELDSPS